MNAILMDDLFGVEVRNIPGLSYIPDYLTKAGEQNLLLKVDQHKWSNSLQRRTQHFGRSYYAPAEKGLTRRTGAASARREVLPFWLMLYGRRLLLEGHCESLPDRVSVNEYQPGQGIGAHIDKGGPIIKSVMILSLGSSCVMEFTHVETGEKVERFLEPRSLTVIAGEARYDWLHGIPKRLTDKVDGMKIARHRRVSIMFRAMSGSLT